MTQKQKEQLVELAKQIDEIQRTASTDEHKQIAMTLRMMSSLIFSMLTAPYDSSKPFGLPK